jgi:hypothetical protein
MYNVDFNIVKIGKSRFVVGLNLCLVLAGVK